MAMKLMYITNRADIAGIAEDSGVDRIFVDLEIVGKNERQKNMDTVISKHRIEDVAAIAKCLKSAELLTRINPIHAGSGEEIAQIISGGADILMLPYFKTAGEVDCFINTVNGKARTCLLCETPEAVDRIDEILSVDGIDEIYIGLNDLHLGYGMKFMFQPLADGTVDALCQKFRQKNIPYGFGGIARLGQGALPAEHVIAEHYRLGSGMVILSRSFVNTCCDYDYDETKRIFLEGVKEIRDFEQSLTGMDTAFFQENHQTVINKVEEIVAGAL